MGTGGRPERQADQPRAGRVRENRLGRARAGPLRLGSGPAPQRGPGRARAYPRGSLRARDRQEPEYRAARMGEDVRGAAGLAKPRERLEPSGRSGEGAGPAARLQGLHRRRPAPGGAGDRAGSPEATHRLRAPGHRSRGHRGSGHNGSRPTTGGPRGPSPGQELSHSSGPRQRRPVAAERSDL